MTSVQKILADTNAADAADAARRLTYLRGLSTDELREAMREASLDLAAGAERLRLIAVAMRERAEGAH